MRRVRTFPPSPSSPLPPPYGDAADGDAKHRVSTFELPSSLRPGLHSVIRVGLRTASILHPMTLVSTLKPSIYACKYMIERASGVERGRSLRPAKVRRNECSYIYK
jgi:hypothetical protein